MWLLIFLILFFIFIKRDTSDQVIIDGYKTTFFNKYSKIMFYELYKNKHNVKEFAVMEDTFMRYEHDTVCGGVSHLQLAMALHETIKERFPGWDFSYHQIALNQMAQPNKIIDPTLRC